MHCDASWLLHCGTDAVSSKKKSTDSFPFDISLWFDESGHREISVITVFQLRRDRQFGTEWVVVVMIEVTRPPLMMFPFDSSETLSKERKGSRSQLALSKIAMCHWVAAVERKQKDMFGFQRVLCTDLCF